MYVYLLLIPLAISQTESSTLKDRTNICSANEFSCQDGTCVDFSKFCDGERNCIDGSDEANCLPGSSDGLSDDLVLHRTRRQASRCRKNQWQCRDGTCISFDGKCDGMVDCPDRSDETHALCRNTKCQPNWFRCTYGACVDGTAPCNNVIECADQSDELLPRCRNETDEFQGQFRCLDGSIIPSSDHCDGNSDCPDGSDETVRACAAKTCPSYLFQCAYGACVDQGSDCNGKRECADGSDEADDLCNRQLPTNPTITTRPPIQTGKCVLPPYPDHGSYVVANAPYATPGQGFESLQLNVTCRQGYGVVGTDIVFCQGGIWSNSIPSCVRFCKLDNHPSVRYRCQVTAFEGQRDCNTYEPTGTVVIPICNTPNYYSAFTLPYMKCIDGSWDYVAVCTPGLARNGTNITILIKDTVEVYINDFLYTGGQTYNAANVTIEIVTGKSVDDLNKVDDSTVDPLDYEIDEENWRMGPVQKVSPDSNAKRNNSGINFNIYNSSVVVNSQ